MKPRDPLGALLVALLPLLWGCSAPQEVPETGGGVEPESTPEETDGEQGEAAATPAEEEPVTSARPYGASPITETVEALTVAALAALQGEPIPQIPVPTRGSSGSDPSVRRRPHDGQVAMPQGEITVLGFFAELDVMLKVGERRTDAPREAQLGGLEIIVYVGSRGARVLGLEARQMRRTPGHPLPSGLTGLEEITRDVLSRLEARDMEELFMGEPERALFGPSLWDEVVRSMPRGERIEEAARFVESVGDVPLTYDLDDTGVIARDSEGTLFMIEMDFDDMDGRIVLDDSPLFRIEHRRAGEDL